MTRILVTGANGQLGRSIKDAGIRYPHFSFLFTDINDLDLTDFEKVNTFIRSNSFLYIINCAAYTAVDKAESEQDKAFAINARLPSMLGNLCKEYSIKLFHISTDYVFDGSKNLPYTEDDTPNPLSVYGKSKLEGEKALWDNPQTIIIRTSWLYSMYGNNFVKTMLKLGSEKNEIGVVSDQVGSPTNAKDLAHALLRIIELSENRGFVPGVYHYANEGICSWYDFAKEIMQTANYKCKVIPLKTSEYPHIAFRPPYSVFNKHKIKSTFNLQIPHWLESLKITLNK